MVTVLDTRQSKPRHPEKIGKPETAKLVRPSWLRVKAPSGQGYERTRALVGRLTLKTVCQEAACPNVATCWAEGHATFMILGAICTRACAFCNVATGLPGPVDANEPGQVAAAIATLGLSHAVITSVDRDDLPDGGAAHFAEVIGEIRRAAPDTTIEVLTPDFLRKDGALRVVVAAAPDVFNHNVETVPRLYPSIRPGARYFHSLRLLQQAKELAPHIFTKSGLMLGLGENREEVAQVMDDMRSAGVDFITLGQYLQPTRRHAEVKRFVPPDEFDELGQLARAKGFLLAASSPLTRSSFHAGADFKRLSAARRTAAP